MVLFKSSINVTRINYYRWKRDLRIVIILLFTVFLVDYYLKGLVQFATQRGETVSFCVLPSLFCGVTVPLRAPKVVFHIGLLLLLCDAPFMHPITPYAVIRSKRKNWWLGEIFYILSLSLLYMSFITIVSTIRILPVVEWENEWGSALDALVYGTKEQSAADIVYNLNIPMVLYQSFAIKYLYPYASQLYTFLTGWETFIVLGLIMYCISLLKKNIAWGISIAGIIIFIEPVINMVSSRYPWLQAFCPVCWSTVDNLTLVGREQVLTIPYVTVMYIVLIVTLILISWLLSRKATIELR